MKQETVNRVTLLILVFAISGVFLFMIRRFLVAMLLAGIFSALVQPLFRPLARRLGGHRAMASLVTLLFLVVAIFLPLATFVGILTAHALRVSETVRPWLEENFVQPGSLSNILESLPFYSLVAPYRGVIFETAAKVVGSISNYFISSLSSATLGTVNFLFSFLVLLYCMFFFLKDGEKLLQKILYYLPLNNQEERRLLTVFTSVTRATLKGTMVIGFLQGGIGGIAFAAIGIPNASFWGTLMAICSILPGVGPGIIWVPAVVFLILAGNVAKALMLAVFCAVTMLAIDNLLRPRLIGKDTKMHELLILFGTLGGIFFFGISGVFLGPILAALFVAIWEIYGQIFRDVLPPTKSAR